MNIIFVSRGAFTDAGGWIWDGHHFKRVPGWNPEAVLELSNMLAIVGTAAHLKTPGLAEASAKVLAGAVEKELAEHVKEGTVLVIQ
jgi:hypothetical protein